MTQELIPALQLQMRQSYRGRFHIRTMRGHRQGYAVVYQAWDRSANRNVALKLMGVPDTAARDAIVQCMVTALDLARTLLEETHAGLPRVYDVLDPDPPDFPAACIVEEWVEGDTLATLQEKSIRPDPKHVVQMTLRLGETLQWLHSKALVHCDVRPSQIMVRFVSADPVEYDWNNPVIVDWDRCRPAGKPVCQEAIMITRPFSAPELSTGDAVDQRADILSLAMTMLHLLTGAPSLGVDENIDSYVRRRLNQVWIPGLRQTLKRALSPDPDERFATMGGFCSQIRQEAVQLLGEAEQARVDHSPRSGLRRQTMSSTLPEYKRRALEQRRADLIEEYDATTGQLGRVLSDVDRVRLERQQQHLEQQIDDIDRQLGAAPAETPLPAGDAKATPGAQTQPDQLFGRGNRWAVLIGVNSYEDAWHYGPLQVCVRDVEATREALLAGGFDPARIRLLTDNTDEKPTRANILAALQSVANATERDDLLLVYYSGHGDAAGGESYLVAREGRHLVLGDTAVSVTRVKQIVERAPARAKVLLLDACHSGADIGQKGQRPMTPEFIQRVFEQAEGLAILSSCKQGQVSYEWRLRERSVFTHFLLEALAGAADRDSKGFVTVQDANRHVANGVKLWASQRNLSQTPTLQYSVAGDIILTDSRQ